MTRAVVVVSGGDAVSPYTTPESACASGLAAGNTDTYIRERLLAAGHRVYTAPAMNARGVVQEPDPASFGAFGGQPLVLPAHMTVMSVGDIDNAGEHLARFVGYLHEHESVTSVCFIGHSNGGLFATAATRILQEIASPVRVEKLVTLGTPWEGAFPMAVAVGETPETSLMGDERALAIVRAAQQRIGEGDKGLVREDTRSYLFGSEGWLAAQAGVLDEVPALLVGGSWLRHPSGDPRHWPFDGLVSDSSALAREVPREVIPLRTQLSFDLVHSIFVAEAFGQDWSLGMTWNPQVLDAVEGFLAEDALR